MKLLFFDDFKLGVLKADQVVDVSALVRDIPHTGPHNLISGLIERFGDYRGKLRKGGRRTAAACRSRACASGRRCPSPSTSTAWRSTTWKTARARSRRRSTLSTSRRTAIIGDGDTMVLPDVPATDLRRRSRAGAGDRQARRPTCPRPRRWNISSATSISSTAPRAACRRPATRSIR